MKQQEKIVSFSEFSFNSKKKTEASATNSIKEAVVTVGDIFKVKAVYDIKREVIQEYIDKTVEQTGKNPLDTFSMEEIAECIVKDCLDKHLSDAEPSVTVGDQESESEFQIADTGEAEDEEYNTKQTVEFDMGETEGEILDFENFELVNTTLDDNEDESEKPKTEKPTVLDYKKKEEMVEEDIEMSELDKLFEEAGYTVKKYYGNED